MWCYVVLGAGVVATDELRAELATVVADALGKSFKPSGRPLHRRAARRPRNAKVLRRAIRAVAAGTDPGDLSSLEDPATLDAVRAGAVTVPLRARLPCSAAG